jgi:hypothetical protein
MKPKVALVRLWDLFAQQGVQAETRLGRVRYPVLYQRIMPSFVLVAMQKVRRNGEDTGVLLT